MILVVPQINEVGVVEMAGDQHLDRIGKRIAEDDNVFLLGTVRAELHNAFIAAIEFFVVICKLFLGKFPAQIRFLATVGLFLLSVLSSGS